MFEQASESRVQIPVSVKPRPDMQLCCCNKVDVCTRLKTLLKNLYSSYWIGLVPFQQLCFCF